MAIAEQDLTVAPAFQIAAKHQRDANLAEAEKLYRKILQAQPGSPDVLINLASHELGRSLVQRLRNMREGELFDDLEKTLWFDRL